MINQGDINIILKFMPTAQAKCFIAGLIGEEKEYFKRIANNITMTIEEAPAIYETEDKGEEIKPVLHYFWGNVDIYITEIDKSRNNQHFGYTSLGLGYFEAGCIDLEHLFKELPELNLDFNFRPETIVHYRKIYEA